MRILIIEDNRDIAENIGDYFETRGHVSDFAMDGITGLHLALTGEYDVIVLDLMLPGMDGLTLCTKLRQEGGKTTPVLMLTARDTLDDKLAGFHTGADDYLVKPFALEELAARVQALTRRLSRSEGSLLQVGNLTLDTATLKVHRQGQNIELNNTCLTLLKILLHASPQVVTRNELERALWGDTPPGSDALRTHMYTLRNKIDKPFASPLIHTLHGIGFRMEEAS
ncbi:response regulator transcription factor [Desulfoluna sp.]|uniref:response regulator transcription factor n=1 Tax=Desulfoluna sp. TaxID=2045199 RepID=UPI00345AE3A9